MQTKISLSKEYKAEKITLIIGNHGGLEQFGFSQAESDYINTQIEKEKEIIRINKYSAEYILFKIGFSKIKNRAEAARTAGSKALGMLPDDLATVCVYDNCDKSDHALKFAEGMALANYKFLKYYKDIDKKAPKLKEIQIFSAKISAEAVTEMNNLVEAVYFALDIAQSPYAELDAAKLAQKVTEAGKEVGFTVENLNKKQIEALQMGGLLGVNQGSETPPVFSIMTWKPENAVNQKPIVLVGKGVMFDTGGVYTKPYPHMNEMKLDKSGAAGVIGTIYALAKNKMPVHVIALVAATDNAVDAKSYVPGDVLRMHNGLFVEVIHTDAEGRLTLADALSYADKFEPELVMDMATLTGAAAAAIGVQGCVVMGTAENATFEMLEKSGEEVYERTAKFPFWDEYDKLLESKIADLTNLGGPEAGAITAGKFLANFTKSPWIHIDIAGPSILKSNDAYRTAGGNGFGTRLLYQFFKNYIKL